MNGTGPPPRPGRCPECGGRLGDPVSGEVHCYVECEDCETWFDLMDARVVLSGGSPSA